MTLNLCTPCFSRLLHHPSSSSSSLPKISETCPNHTANTNTHTPFRSLLFFSTSSLPNPNQSSFISTKASVSESHNETSDDTAASLLDQQLILRLAATAKDADEALQMIADNSSRTDGVVSTSDCCSIISAALNRNNPQLALSIFYAMRATFHQVVGESGPLAERWKWSRPNANVYTLLIQGLTAVLRVSDALRVIRYICEISVSPGEEVPFGKIVKCPSCRIAVGVAQPQQGIQIVSCAKCRYQYELVSGDIVSIESEEIRISSCRTQHGHYHVGKGVKIRETDEARHSCCCSLYCGADPFWSGTHS